MGSLSSIGFWLVIATFFASFRASLLYLRAAGGNHTVMAARRWQTATVIGTALASLLLLSLILLHDFSNGYVYSYTSRSLPLHFLLSSFYAGQQGSFLFWILCSAGLGWWLRGTLKGRKDGHGVLSVYMAVNSMLLLLLVVKSPFDSVWSMFPNVPAGTIPTDGQGLNPLLQNIWMVAHPPVLFVGFASMAIPFSIAVAALWKRSYNLLADVGQKWILFATVVLGAGIIIGGYWAYGVLGWGGYWGWDPVENSSLVPWIIAVALVHTMVVQKKTGKFTRTNFGLAIASFVFVVYSTFLTRSGVLGESSVHSFMDPGTVVYSLLLLFLLAAAAVGFGLLVARSKELGPPTRDVRLFTRESLLGQGALALLLSAAVITFGTSLPLVSGGTVEPSFYDTTNLPLAVLMALLIGIGLFAQWDQQDVVVSLKRSGVSAGIAFLATAFSWFGGVVDAWSLLLIFASLFALAANVRIAWAQRRSGLRTLGGKIAHIGVAAFLVGALISGKFSHTATISLPLNSSVQVLGHHLTYLGHTMSSDGKTAFQVRVGEGRESFTMNPVMFDAGQQGVMRNPDIRSFLTRDIYLSPVSADHAATQAERYTIPKGEAVMMGDVTARFIRFDMGQHAAESQEQAAGTMSVGSVIELSRGSEWETITPVAHYAGNSPSRYSPMASTLLEGNVQLVSMNVGTGSSTVTVEVERPGQESASREVLVVEASMKPLIGLVWLGVGLMTLGFLISFTQRKDE